MRLTRNQSKLRHPPALIKRANSVFLSLALLCLCWLGQSHAAENEQADEIIVVALGDSLTAGYGLPAGQGFVPQLEAALRAGGHNVRVINAGVSGDTSSGGLTRLAWAVPPETQAVILELGANDALRGIDPDLTHRNLDAIITYLHIRALPVLLVGMIAPPNLGADYQTRFAALYEDLAQSHELIFYPFMLEGVAANPALNLADGIHPNAAGIKIIVANILPSVKKLLKQTQP